MGTIDNYLNRKYKNRKISPADHAGEVLINSIDKIEEISNNKLVDIKNSSVIKCSECTNIIGLEDKDSPVLKKCKYCGKAIEREIRVNFNFPNDEILKFYKEYNLKIKKV